MTRLPVCRLVLVLSCTLNPLLADDVTVPPLTESEQSAMNGIEESEVLSTVAFLASDAMAGRNTPSVELNIAAAYVAARFQGAGLEGLGPDGSFLQTTELGQFVVPEQKAVLRNSAGDIRTAGVMFSAPADTSVTAVIAADESPAAVDGKIVVVDELPLPPQAADNPAMILATWSRRLTPLANAKAVAVLVRINDDSLLPEMLNNHAGRALSLPSRFQLPVPVVLVAKDATLDGELTLTMAAAKTASESVSNVVGVLRGSDPELSKQAIVITAHLDHIGRIAGDRGSDPINNGADDNATGVTGVLMLADAFAQRDPRPKRSVIFMTFWGEEKGLLGSQHFAEHPLWPLDCIVANINLEMIGCPEAGAEGKVWCTGWNKSTLGEQLAAGAKRADVEIFNHPQLSEMLYSRSDNFSLVRKGVIAHSFSGGSLHADYHQPTDEVSLLNIPHMTKVIRGLYAGSMPIADGLLTPVKNQSEADSPQKR